MILKSGQHFFNHFFELRIFNCWKQSVSHRVDSRTVKLDFMPQVGSIKNFSVFGFELSQCGTMLFGRIIVNIYLITDFLLLRQTTCHLYHTTVTDAENSQPSYGLGRTKTRALVE